MDSANFIFQPVFSADGGFGRATMGGAGDMLAVADLATFRVLPWAKNTASVFADLYLSDGEPCPFDPRRAMRDACDALATRNLLFVGGVEVECHIFKVVDPRLDLDSCTQPPKPARVEAIRHGYQYMSPSVLDEYEPVVDRLRRALIDLGLPLRDIGMRVGPRSARNHPGPIDRNGCGRCRGADAPRRQAGRAPHGADSLLHDQTGIA